MKRMDYPLCSSLSGEKYIPLASSLSHNPYRYNYYSLQGEGEVELTLVNMGSATSNWVKIELKVWIFRHLGKLWAPLRSVFRFLERGSVMGVGWDNEYLDFWVKRNNQFLVSSNEKYEVKLHSKNYRLARILRDERSYFSSCFSSLMESMELIKILYCRWGSVVSYEAQKLRWTRHPGAWVRVLLKHRRIF